jgi:hypothetical protein
MNLPDYTNAHDELLAQYTRDMVGAAESYADTVRAANEKHAAATSEALERLTNGLRKTRQAFFEGEAAKEMPHEKYAEELRIRSGNATL